MTDDLFAQARLEQWERLAAQRLEAERKRFGTWENQWFPSGPGSTRDFATCLSWVREHHAALCDCVGKSRPLVAPVRCFRSVLKGEGPTGRLVKWLDRMRAGIACPIARYGGWHCSPQEFMERGPF